MIRSFRDADAEKLFRRNPSRRLPVDAQRVALRRQLILDAAETLADLRVPPGNRLEKLAGDREGHHSIRINQRWRICFRWRAGDAHDVEIVAYH
jgi:proteic killer suppression protein